MHEDVGVGGAPFCFQVLEPVRIVCGWKSLWVAKSVGGMYGGEDLGRLRSLEMLAGQPGEGEHQSGRFGG